MDNKKLQVASIGLKVFVIRNQSVFLSSNKREHPPVASWRFRGIGVPSMFKWFSVPKERTRCSAAEKCRSHVSNTPIVFYVGATTTKRRLNLKGAKLCNRQWLIAFGVRVTRFIVLANRIDYESIWAYFTWFKTTKLIKKTINI